MIEHPASIHVVIAHNSAFTAGTLSNCVHSLLHTAEVTVASTADEAIRVLNDTRTDLAIIGLNLPDVDGVELTRRVALDRLAIRIVVVCDKFTEWLWLGLRSLRINGVLDLSVETPCTVQAAIASIVRGKWYRSQSSGSQSARRYKIDAFLTPAQVRVLATIATGASDEWAAEQLGLRIATVHSHRQQIMRKLGVQTRSELVLAAMCIGVIRVTEDGTVAVVAPHLQQRQQECLIQKD